eukprot:COSAG05_NODE_9744_length_604_cov_2.295875_1_plen_134_part_10
MALLVSHSRKMYDQFGSEGIQGMGGAGGMPGGFSFNASDPSKIFEQFFGGEDPFSALFGNRACDGGGGMPAGARVHMGGMPGGFGSGGGSGGLPPEIAQMMGGMFGGGGGVQGMQGMPGMFGMPGPGGGVPGGV